MPTIPAGGLVLVTGSNGLVAGITVQKLLDNGYSVRGTVRSIAKSQWMLSHYGPKFSLIEVPDMAADHAYDKAIKGVDGIAHMSSAVVVTKDPNEGFAPLVKSLRSILEAAAKEPTVKNVVFTSSTAAVHDLRGQYTIEKNAFNEEAISRVWDSPTDDTMLRTLELYAAAKAVSEKEGFKFVADGKGSFTFNTVVPHSNYGAVSSPQNTGFPSTTGLFRLVFLGNEAAAMLAPVGFFVDVEDTALLHVAALTQPDVQNERLFASPAQYTWKEVLEISRKLYPKREILKEIKEKVSDGGVLADEALNRAEELLKRLGKNGFSSLEETVRKATKQIVEMEGLDIPETRAETLLKKMHK